MIRKHKTKKNENFDEKKLIFTSFSYKKWKFRYEIQFFLEVDFNYNFY